MTFNSSGPRVLVVDDLDEMRALIRRALSARGYQVDVAASLAEARALDPARYDAVLVDAGLGREHGIDLIEALRSADPAAAGRCLVMTGGATDAIPAGVPRLVKPFHIAQLLEALGTLLQTPATPGLDPQPGSVPAARPVPGADAIPVDARFDDAVGPAMREFTGSEGPDDAGTGPHASTRAGPRTDTIAGAVVPKPASALNGSWPAQAGPAATEPAAAEPAAWQLLRLIRRLRTRERHELVDFLHDGPIQELTAASIDLQVLARSAGPDLTPGLAAMQRQLDLAAGSLRWLVDGHWPFLLPETRLADAVRQRTAWLLATPATMPPDEPPADLCPAEVTVVADVAELMLLGLLPASPHPRAQVAVNSGADYIQIELILTAAGGGDLSACDPAPALAALAAALGATAHADLVDRRWQARILLTRQANADPV